MNGHRMTVAEAAETPGTALHGMRQASRAGHAERLAVAHAIVAAEGITLAEAFARIWDVPAMICEEV